MTRSVQYKGNKITPELHIGLPPTSLKLTPDSFPKWRTKRCNIGLGYLATLSAWIFDFYPRFPMECVQGNAADAYLSF